MPVEENKAVMQRICEQVIQGGNFRQVYDRFTASSRVGESIASFYREPNG